MSFSQETMDRIHQFAGTHVVGGYIDGLVSETPSHKNIDETHDSSNQEVIRMLYSGFITIGLSMGALTGYISGGGRKKFLWGGWKDTLVGTAAGLMIGLGFGHLGHALLTMRTSR